MASPTASLIAIYTTAGEPAAYLAYPYLFTRSGDWIGWVTPTREVSFDLGYYVGYLTNDPRILRRRSDPQRPRLSPPSAPQRIRVPMQVPLAPMMSELSYEVVDVLMEEPQRLHTSDAGELRNDLD